MASYLSKPTQYAAYKPEVDAELYGKLIMKKEADYEAGLQKAQQDVDYLASMPVANEADRQHLQELVHNVTTELNQSTNVDWSNLSVQKLTDKHITKIANDEKLQKAIASASVYKNGYQKAKSSEEDNGGLDAANQFDWQVQVAPWLNSNEAGKKFDGRFNPFVDIWKGASKVAEEVPIEEWTETSNLGDVDNPNKTAFSRSFKARRPEKITNSVLGYLNTDPGASNQVFLQAKYQYKDYDVMDIAKELYDKDKTALKHYEIEFNRLNEELTRLGDQSNPLVVKKRNEIEKRQRLLSEEYGKESEDLRSKNIQIAIEAFSDNDRKNQLFKDLYIDKFVQQRVENYSFNNSGNISILGETAFKKGLDVEKNIRENEKQEWEKEKYNAEMKKLTKENTDSQYGLAFAAGIPTDPTKNSYGVVKKNIDDEEVNTSDAIRRVAYNIFKNNGGFSGLKENSEGGVDIVNPFTIATVSGTPTKMPTGIYLTGGKYKDESGKEKYYDGFINQLIKSYKSGDYKKVASADGEVSVLAGNAGNFNISDIDLPSIISLSESLDLLTQKKDMIARKEKEIMDESGTTDIVNELNDKNILVIPQTGVFVNPAKGIPGQNVSKPTSISGTDVLNYNTLTEDDQFILNNFTQEQFNRPNFSHPELKKKIAQLGLTYDKVMAIRNTTSEKIRVLVSAHKDVSEKLNKAFEKMNIILTPSRRDWTGIKEEDKKARKNAVINYAQLVTQQAGGELMQSAKDVVDLITKEATGEPEIAYTQDALTKEYKLAVTRGGETKEMVVTPEQASQWNWDPMIGERTRLQEQVLWSPTKSTVPLNKNTGQQEVPSFYNAKSIGLIKNKGLDIRFHIIPEYTAFSKVPQYYIYYYQKNVHTGKEEPIEHRPVPNNDIGAIDILIAEKIKQIEASNNKR
jgi:hypothetical protein